MDRSHTSGAWMARATGPGAAILLALPFYATFIGRSAFRIDGKRYYSLFDDAMISMRYGENLAHGHGLVWNVTGHAVEGYSNLLWTLWMAFLHVLPIPSADTSLAVMITAVAILCATVWVVHAVALELAPGTPGVAFVSALLTAFLYPLVYWSLRGMEVSLVALVVTWSVLVAVRLQRGFTARRLALLAFLMAVGVLIRDDVVVPCVVIATVAAHTGMRLLIYHQALANTYYLKVGNVPLGVRLGRGATALLHSLGTGLYAPLALAAAYLVTNRERPLRPQHLILAIFAAVCAYSVYVGGDAWESNEIPNRYLTPTLPLLFALAAAGAWSVVRAPGRMRLRVFLSLAVITVIATVATRHWYPISLQIVQPPTTYENRQLAVAPGLRRGRRGRPRLGGGSGRAGQPLDRRERIGARHRPAAVEGGRPVQADDDPGHVGGNHISRSDGLLLPPPGRGPVGQDGPRSGARPAAREGVPPRP